MKCNGISRNPKHTKGCDSQSFVLIKPLSLRYKARKSSIRAADLPPPIPHHRTSAPAQEDTDAYGQAPGAQIGVEQRSQGDGRPGNPSGRRHSPHGNQAISSFAVLHHTGADIARVIGASEGHRFHAKHRGKKMKLLPLLPCYTHGDCSARTDRCLDNIIPY